MQAAASAYEFGSISGSTFAVYFFAFIAAVIGFAAYRLSLHMFGSRLSPHTRKSLTHLATAMVGFLVFVVLFSAIYFSSLDGFYRAEMRGDQLVLHYILPERIIVLRLTDIGEVTRMPTFKGRWRLLVYGSTGQVYESANASYQDVRRAWRDLDALLSESGDAHQGTE
jgi:amino acid transporter